MTEKRAFFLLLPCVEHLCSPFCPRHFFLLLQLHLHHWNHQNPSQLVHFRPQQIAVPVVVLTLGGLCQELERFRREDGQAERR